jgi:hypothetical protein
MGQVYSNVDRLIAWLPSPVDGIHLQGGCMDENICFASRVASGGHTLYGLLRSSEEMIAVLTRLFFHDFWSRIWIVQELALSKGKEFWWEGQMLK